ncbi:hypothetical protein BU24DRAFT_492557 [Aaosphaeria arxii CBS 175.79]|uniref:Uncharacterized protein n=1 Tax=Aaosphaeria arxii CBS 175.79 TaxID=1450172 RepID=A0A6A5XU55_9PLEO|nr:uncharacterized protein BU24DRAFT_492557 [Aaosphaeria arxii CBS 175.79]KAF2016483.1 hypothetical protein BU24DRAFT_492557 [Aaosphaeria arxii CBS 175.79]
MSSVAGAQATRSLQDEDLVPIMVKGKGLDPPSTINPGVVCFAPAKYLFEGAPELRNYIHDQAIVIPSTGLDEDMLRNVVCSLVNARMNNTTPDIQLEDNPLSYIHLHVILTHFGMREDADRLLAGMWSLYERVELLAEQVWWIWITFGSRPETSGSRYRPLYAEAYVQIMAWQLVHSQSLGRMSDDVRQLVYGSRFGWFPEIRQVVEARERLFGTAQGFEIRMPSNEQEASMATQSHTETGSDAMPVNTPDTSVTSDGNSSPALQVPQADGSQAGIPFIFQAGGSLGSRVIAQPGNKRRRRHAQ